MGETRRVEHKDKDAILFIPISMTSGMSVKEDLFYDSNQKKSTLSILDVKHSCMQIQHQQSVNYIVGGQGFKIPDEVLEKSQLISRKITANLHFCKKVCCSVCLPIAWKYSESHFVSSLTPVTQCLTNLHVAKEQTICRQRYASSNWISRIAKQLDSKHAFCQNVV